MPAFARRNDRREKQAYHLLEIACPLQRYRNRLAGDLVEIRRLDLRVTVLAPILLISR
jgi:hypothetical protein